MAAAQRHSTVQREDAFHTALKRVLLRRAISLPLAVRASDRKEFQMACHLVNLTLGAAKPLSAEL
jgi:hypothetical protein